MSKKQKIISLGLFFFFLIFQKPILAQENKFITNINPVRGADFRESSHSPNDFVEFQKDIATKNNIPVTWLIRPDYFLNYPDNIFLNSEFKTDDLGIFLEVTPTWTKRLNIKYQDNLPWYNSKNVFLSGYNPKDRLMLIDTAMINFKDVYGFYPKSVGAWHIDPTSANYLVDKYGINNFLICTDQTSTDGYQIWGGWWGIPYYPSKNNLLIPASSQEDKLNAIVLFWALRDPVNAYGEGQSSLYSLQANDYTKLNLDTDYFNKLSNIYLNQTTNNFGQVTVGLENDDNFFLENEYKNQIESLVKTGSQFLTSTKFSDWYFNNYPKLTPSVELYGNNPLNPTEEFKWILTTKDRTFLTKSNSNNDWSTRDFRVYTPDDTDHYESYRNIQDTLNWKITPQIDSVFNIFQQQYSKNINPKLITIIFSVIITLIMARTFYKKSKVTPFIIILIGTLILSLTMVRSGLSYNFGIGFWGPNGHDGIWHLSLINQLQQNIPPQNPVFSGTILNNYHWGFDLLAAILGKIIGNNVFAYFQVLPIILGLSLGYFSYKLVQKNTKDKKVPILFTFLIYFCGSFGWIYTLVNSSKLGGESLFWSMQSISTLINPPFAMSLIFILIGLILWTKNNLSSKYKLAILNGVIFGSLAGIKIYAGILVGLTLVIIWVFDFIKTKKIFNYNFVTWATTLIISIGILLLLGVLKSSSLLEFKPFWFVHSMIESIDKFYLPKLASYRSSLSQNLSIIKFPLFIAIESVLLVVFLIGNMGLRSLGLIAILKKIKQKDFSHLEKFSLVLMVISFLIPLFFVQKGTAWNTIQFFYYFLFFSNLFFAQILADILKRKNKLFLGLVILILIISNLSTIATIKDYLGNPPPSAIPTKEVEALNFLKDQPIGNILTYPYDKYKKDQLGLDTPIPIYLYETTAYVSAFSNKTIFLEDEMNLDITGFDWESRRDNSLEFFTTNNEYLARGFLINNQIDYIYLVGDQKINLNESQLQINQIFNNGQVKIYQVQK